MIEKYLTTEQVSNILQIHPFTVLKFIREGRLKGIKLGRVYRIKESDVHEFLTNMSITPKASDSSKHKQSEVLISKPTERHSEVSSAKTAKKTVTEVFEIPVVESKDGDEHYYII